MKMCTPRQSATRASSTGRKGSVGLVGFFHLAGGCLRQMTITGVPSDRSRNSEEEIQSIGPLGESFPPRDSEALQATCHFCTVAFIPFSFCPPDLCLRRRVLALNDWRSLINDFVCPGQLPSHDVNEMPFPVAIISNRPRRTPYT